MHSTSVSTPELLRLFQVRQDDAKDVVGVVSRGADLVGADEVDEHVLVHQRQAETIGAEIGPVTVWMD